MSNRRRRFVLALSSVAVVLSAPSLAWGAASSSAYNPRAINKCRDLVDVRFSTSPVRNALYDPLGNLTVGSGRLGINGLETLYADGGKRLYYFEGRNSVPARSYNGHVALTALERAPRIGRNSRCRKGAGGAARLNGVSYRLAPKSIPSSLRFPETDGDWNSYSEYGPRGPAGDHKYVIWTWISNDAPSGRCTKGEAVSHGGYVRALVPAGTRFEQADVQTVNCRDYPGGGPNSGPGDGVDNGSVEAMYGRFNTGGQSVWGWTVKAHTYRPCRTCATTRVPHVR